MMRNIISFIKYHNLFPIILGLVLLATAGAFANEDVRNAVIGEEIATEIGIDNSAILAADLDNFDFRLTIHNVQEDVQNHYVNYAYQTLAIQDNRWQPVLREQTLTVSKMALAGEDLGLYATEELGEVVDYELSYLKQVQKLEKERGQTQIVKTTDYTGLIGLALDMKNNILPGYEPVVKPPEPPPLVVGEFTETRPPQFTGVGSLEASIGAGILTPPVLTPPAEPAETGSPTASDSVTGVGSLSSKSVETVLDSHPDAITVLTEARFEFHSILTEVGSLSACTFQCQVNKQGWMPCESPKLYPGLVPGEYAFEVFAVDASGNYDPTPASFSWVILQPEPTVQPEPVAEPEQLAPAEPAAPPAAPAEQPEQTVPPEESAEPPAEQPPPTEQPPAEQPSPDEQPAATTTPSTDSGQAETATTTEQ